MAVVDNRKERIKLCKQARELGGESKIVEDRVCVLYDGTEEIANSIIELFKQYRINAVCKY